MTIRHPSLSVLGILALVLAGCSTAPRAAEDRAILNTDSNTAVQDFRQKDPRLPHFFDTAYAYAIFPEVGQGGLGVGGAFGHGEIIQGGHRIGYCSLSQGSIGAQLGGQSFSEIIFFENKAALDSFTTGDFAFDAAASAVAASAGASATADYKKGVVVFTKSQGGLMFQASIGGQKFAFESNETVKSKVATENP